MTETHTYSPLHRSKAPLAECWNCPLATKPCAPTTGPKDSKVVLVSRSPGFHEAMEGKPFSGPSGKVLDHLLKINGVKREEIRVTNVVLCAPDEGKVPPEAIKACAPRLRNELDNADTVIAAGAEAVNLLIGRGSIDSHRGYRIDRGGRTYVATNNPALVLRDDSTFPNLVKDFKRALNPSPPQPFPEVEVIDEPASAVRYIEYLMRCDTPIACDTESSGGLTHKATLACVQFATSSAKANVIGREALSSTGTIAALKRLFESPVHKFVWHNGKHDIKILRYGYGINARVDHDTILLSYALDERSGDETQDTIHALEYLLMEEYSWPNYEPANVREWKKSSGTKPEWDTVRLDLYDYAGKDAGGTYTLFSTLGDRARADGVWGYYADVLIPAVEVLARMELHGIHYNIHASADIYEYSVRPELDGLLTELRTFLDNPILNPGSPQQVAKLYYDDWGIKHAMRSRPDKARSVDDTARKEILADRFTFLEEMRAGTTLKEPREKIKHAVAKIDRHSKLKKQASNYLLGLIREAEADEDGRIYTWFSLTGTNSGRLSSRRPNLQNITRPGRHEDIPNIRSLFYASSGRYLVQADYSQAELRCMAAYSGDATLYGVYRDGIDLHNLTAERFYGPNYTNENRQSSKNMNFGVGYLQSAETFQEKHGIPVEEARPFIEWWRKEFAGVFIWHKEIEKDIRSKGYLRSAFGGKRRFYLLTRENINASIREGINWYPQHTAAMLTLTSCINICGEIDWNRAALCLTVHDSILADVDENYIDEFSTITKEIMEARARMAIGWELPFLVDIGVGQTWSEAK